MTRKTILALAALAAVLVLLAGCGGGSNGSGSNGGANSANEGAAANTPEVTPVFKIGGIPDQDVAVLTRRFGGVADYLSEQTGLTVEYVPTQDYAALVTAFQRGDIQLAWFGGLTGVQARNMTPGSEAIAMRPEDGEFHSVFIAQADLDVNSLSDLAGLSFAFGSESSTSGHLMPRHFLMQAGIDPEQDFDGTPNYTGSHDKTWQLVESGAYQAGALNAVVWKSRVEEGSIDLSKVKVVETTPAYFDYNWTINDVDAAYGDGTKEAVAAALLGMNMTEHAELLEPFQTDQFVETNNGNYAEIEEVAKQLGIIK
ncbi:putative selenate ABC transporter substrate-binding protein [Xylanibacillus composti]|nr:putative selenate ABC transporter substrate-binding protein [Xylanibacillus composti]